LQTFRNVPLFEHLHAKSENSANLTRTFFSLKIPYIKLQKIKANIYTNFSLLYFTPFFEAF
jgi:hypothetical protein